MAYLKLFRDELRHNYTFLDDLFKEHGVKWGITTKLLCGNREYLEEIINLGVKEVHDSRTGNLKEIKEIDPDTMTIYIKPPPKDTIVDVVKYADVSLNTELTTLHALSAEAVRQKKIHKVIIMIEMGDLREGVMREELIHFYEQVFDLPGIEVIGLGTNLNCLHGVLPDSDKLIQLSLYKQIIELKFNKTIPLVSGGTTVTIPLMMRNQLPAGINHFRVGEALFFGADLYSGGTLEGMSDNVLELNAHIIEISEKPVVPDGEMRVNTLGEETEIEEEDIGKTTYRAILDIGYLDVQPDYLIPVVDGIEVSDVSSDMMILDVGDNPENYKVGDIVRFKLKYMGALSLMSSDYIDKRVDA